MSRKAFQAKKTSIQTNQTQPNTRSKQQKSNLLDKPNTISNQQKSNLLEKPIHKKQKKPLLLKKKKTTSSKEGKKAARFLFGSNYMSEDESSQEFKIEKSSQQNQQLEKHHMQLNIQLKNKPQNSNLLDQPTHHKASEDGDTEKKDFKDVDMLTNQQKEDMINIFYSKARSDAKDSNNSNGRMDTSGYFHNHRIYLGIDMKTINIDVFFKERQGE